MLYRDAYERALRHACGIVNAYYSAIAEPGDPDGDLADDCYWQSIEVLAAFFGFTPNEFEDRCTDVREFGWDNN